MRACVRTSRPVVGSSMTTTRGSQTRRRRDRHALLLAARELVREAAGEGAVGGQPDAAEGVERGLAGVAVRHVGAHHVRDRVADPQRRVERRRRVLRHVGDEAAAQLADGLRALAGERRAVDRRRARRRRGSPAARSRAAPAPVVVLPLPDSPTSPSTSPARSSSETPSTIGTSPRSVTRRSSTVTTTSPSGALTTTRSRRWSGPRLRATASPIRFTRDRQQRDHRRRREHRPTG